MKDPTIQNVPATDRKLNASVLDAFDLLKTTKDDGKLIGGAKIIAQLQSNEVEKDIKYVLKRLVRSLGANVPELRTGYFATLVALLKKFESITVSELLELVKKELHANGSSKSEVGDVALGQILLCSAIFRSGAIFKCSSEEQTQVVQLLCSASKKKSYLSAVAYPILLDFVNSLNEDQFSTILWPNIKAELKKEIKDQTLDTLYFLMVVSEKFPKQVKLKKLIGVDDVLHEDNIHVVCEKILTGLDFNSVGHPIYKEIGVRIASSPHLEVFWTSAIDSHLVKHNRNRELVAISLLNTILNNLQDNTEIIPALISKNFFKLFMDWFKGLQTASKIRSKRDDEDDSKIMIKKQKELLNTLAKALKGDKVSNETRVAVLTKLMIDPGEINFTDITGTTIVRSTIADLEKSGVKKMAKIFKGILLNTSDKVVKDTTRKWFNNERVKAADQLSYLVSHEAMKDDTEFKLTYMKLLMCFSFFKISGEENIAISSELSGSIKQCFYRCFTSRFSNVDNLVSVLSSLCSFICNILKKEEVRTKLEKQFPKENMDCWETLMEICNNIEKGESKSKIDKVFLILLYQLGLFLFSEPAHVKIATSSIMELKSCYEHYRKGKKKKQKSNVDLSEEPEWIEVLVEVLLSILSAESSVLRSVVQCVFRLLWEYLTPSSIGQIVSVLDPESESNPLHDSDSEADESGNEESNDAGESDKEESEQEESEKENSNDENGGKENSEDSDSDSNVEDDDDDDVDMKTPDQLRLAVQKALGAAVGSDTESIDADMIDEEEGKKLDDALAEAFKQFNQGKGKKDKKERKDKKALSDFRIRVLDLIDIYLEKDPSMDICLGMIAPLTRCLEFCIQDNQFAELENRVRKTIKLLTKIRKFATIEDVTIEVLSDYLKATIDKGGRSHFLYQALGDVITFFATFIIHCSQKIQVIPPKSPKKKKQSHQAMSPIVEILKEAIQSYFQNRSCMIPIIFFHNVLQTEWESNFDLVPIVIENIFNKDVRQFRRNEGLELIAGFYRALKRSKPSEKEIAKLCTLELMFESTLKQTLKDGTEFQVKNNFFVVLKKLINTMKQFHESCHVESKVDFKALLDFVGTNKGTVISNKPQISEVQNNGKTPKSKKKKRKLAKINGHAETQNKRAKKDSNETVNL